MCPKSFLVKGCAAMAGLGFDSRSGIQGERFAELPTDG